MLNVITIILAGLIVGMGIVAGDHKLALIGALFLVIAGLSQRQK